MTTFVRFREPLRNVAMNGEFERLIKTILESPARAAAVSNHAWTPPLDVWETEGELVYAFDLPGIPEEKIAVDLEDSTLTVSGSRERAETGGWALLPLRAPLRRVHALGRSARGHWRRRGPGALRQRRARSPRPEARTVQAPPHPGHDDRRGRFHRLASTYFPTREAASSRLSVQRRRPTQPCPRGCRERSPGRVGCETSVRLQIPCFRASSKRLVHLDVAGESVLTR